MGILRENNFELKSNHRESCFGMVGENDPDWEHTHKLRCNDDDLTKYYDAERKCTYNIVFEQNCGEKWKWWSDRKERILRKTTKINGKFDKETKRLRNLDRQLVEAIGCTHIYGGK